MGSTYILNSHAWLERDCCADCVTCLYNVLQDLHLLYVAKGFTNSAPVQVKWQIFHFWIYCFQSSNLHFRSTIWSLAMHVRLLQLLQLATRPKLIASCKGLTYHAGVLFDIIGFRLQIYCFHPWFYYIHSPCHDHDFNTHHIDETISSGVSHGSSPSILVSSFRHVM